MIRHLKQIPLLWVSYAIVLLPMLYTIISDMVSLPTTYGNVFGTNDPDPWMRLTLVRDLLSGGSWYSHTITHSDAPFGNTISPWTRPLDIVIAFFTQIQPHSIDLNTRLLNTALLLPLLWMGLLLFGLFKSIRTMTNAPQAVFMVAVIISLSPMAKNYFGSGNADHHAMLAALFACALPGLLAATPTGKQLVTSGGLFGLLLWISPEILPVLALIYGWYGLGWLRGEAEALHRLRLLATTIAAIAAAALMVERPPSAWFTPLYDTLSIVHIVPLTLAAAATWLLALAPAHSPRTRLLLAGALSLLILGITRGLFPLVFDGMSAGTDSFIQEKFLPNIAEMYSVFHPDNSSAFKALLLWPPLLALIALIMTLRREETVISRSQAWFLLYCVLFTGTLHLLHLRFYYYFYPFVLLTLAAILTALMTPEHPSLRTYWPARAMVGLPPERQMYRRLPILVAVLAMPLMFASLNPAEKRHDVLKQNICSATATSLIESGKLTALLGNRPLILLAPTGLGGHIGFFTPYRIIASNYHREGAGLRYLSEAEEITSLAALRPHLKKRKVDALLLCPLGAARSSSVLDKLWQEKAGASWLTRVRYPSPPIEKDVREQREKDGILSADPVIFLVR